MPFDNYGDARHDRQPERGESSRLSRQRGSVSDDDKMGLILLVVALLAVGSYTLLVFSGVLGAQHG